LNGAGKTTTFKILTGELDATSGKAFINGYNINHQKFKARRNLGFCVIYILLLNINKNKKQHFYFYAIY
jgi:ABC-type multidrug transport system ATPase subunit